MFAITALESAAICLVFQIDETFAELPSARNIAAAPDLVPAKWVALERHDAIA
jgi:hypothetical protein